MKTVLKLLLTVISMTALIACSPPEPKAEPFIDGKKHIDKAKNVESIILEQNKTIDQKIDQSTNNQ